jgi:hypothetical protein
MKAHFFQRTAAVLTGSTVLLVFLLTSFSLPAQDQKEQKVTVYASPGSQDKQNQQGVYKIKIIKDDNGKKVVIDTTISITGGMDKEKLDELMGNLEGQMEDLKEQMKDLRLSFGSFEDTAVNDSSGHHRAYSFRFHSGPSCHGIAGHENPGAFNYHFEMPDVPEIHEFPEQMEREWGNGCQGYSQGPGVMMIPGRGGESLSDVLGNIPMSRVKSYKVIDKKGGKRIIIDLDDGFGMEPGNGMVYIHSHSHPSRPPRGMGHQKDVKVIINTDGKTGQDNGNQDQQSPPSNPEPKKPQTDKLKI